MKDSTWFGLFMGAVTVYGICAYELGKYNEGKYRENTINWKIGTEEPDDSDGVMIVIEETARDSKVLRTKYRLDNETAIHFANRVIEMANISPDIVGGDEDEEKEVEA